MSRYRKYRSSLNCGNTFGIGIVNDKGEILADERDTYRPPAGKGIIPNEAAEHHEKLKEEILKRVLEKAGICFDDVDIISYSAGPGLPPPLLIGANFSIELSKKFKKPLIPVNHPLAHLEIGRATTTSKDPVFVYLSGGNTQIIAFTEGKYRVFGETLDIAVGNAFDSIARQIGIEPPYGPNFEKTARGKYIELPYTVKGCDLSFSGITTAAINLLKKGVPKEDVAYSLQEICFSMITEVTERVLAHTGKKEVLLVGGVAANKRLQEMMNKMCSDRDAKMYVVPQEYSGDNGAQIALVGMLAYNSGWNQKIKDKIDSRWRIDEVEITWLK